MTNGTLPDTRHPVPTSSVPTVAGRQGGVFTAAQARAEGWTDRIIRRRICAGRWLYVAGRGLAEASDGVRGWTAFQLATAGQLSLPGAVISHHTAAALHGFPGPVQGLLICDVILPKRRRTGPAIRVHLLRLDPAETQIGRGGLRVTTASRTALDCLARLPFPAALDLWAWVLTRRILDPEALSAAIASRRNWSGTRQLRELHAVVGGGAVSGAEFRFHELLTKAGLRGWSANVPIRDGAGLVGTVDVGFLGERVLIEIDGFRAHSSRTSFVADRRRQNRLVGAGFTVLRFTWTDLTQRPIEVIAEIRQALTIGHRFDPLSGSKAVTDRAGSGVGDEA